MIRGQARLWASVVLVGGGLVAVLLLLPRFPHPVTQTPSPREEARIRGRVADENGPIAGARVRIKATGHTTRTDAAGEFHLRRTQTCSSRITAAKEGYFIAGAAPASLLTLTLRPLPAEDFDEYEWVDPAADTPGRHNCARCHEEIFQEWNASAHARSATGRHFLNLYEGTDRLGNADVGWNLLKEHPLGSGVCSSCHAPTMPVGLDPAFDIRDVRGVASRGVHCDYCHKIKEVGDGELGFAHGQFNLNLLRPAEGQLFFGPLDDVDRGDDAYSPLYSDSKYCASCHEGVIFGVPVYTTYSEWLASPSRRQGKHCQSCHMTPTGRMTNLAPGHGGVERDPRTLANHRFFDGSLEAMLRRCVQVSPTVHVTEEGIRVDVEVMARDVGHRVPTGFIDRHLILVVEAWDGEGKSVEALSGSRLPGPVGKPLTGKAGRLYAKLLTDPEGQMPVPFWRAGSTPIDTRLEPGKADRVEVVFPKEVVRIRVRLLYRRFWEEVARTKKWADTEMVIGEKTVDVTGGR